MPDTIDPFSKVVMLSLIHPTLHVTQVTREANVINLDTIYLVNKLVMSSLHIFRCWSTLTTTLQDQ